MNLFQALRYFFREASINLARGWKVSLLAVLTIAVSLFLGGVFLLASSNLGRAIERWQGEARIAIYLTAQTSDGDLARLAKRARGQLGVTSVEALSTRDAERRFREMFPSLADLVAGAERDPLPASLEIVVDERRLGGAAQKAWIEGWRKVPGVSQIDDDREWLAQLRALVAVVRVVGLVLGAVLLGAAIFTIGSVIRLTAYLHREEISILRLVGATEFYIRGPFYAEGLLQGVLGGLVALGGLFAAWKFLVARLGGELLPNLLASEFLAPRQLAILVALGALAGLAGAIASLRGETLRSAG